ncbi:MAG: ABC transporter ATP-binding protein [Planctomycetia bacterium]
MLEVEGLAKHFPAPGGLLRVLDGVSLRLGPGGRLAVMGPSGSGKSTLLSILGTLDEPTAGSVRLDGVDPFALPPRERPAFRNRAIGFVFQEHHLLGGCTALDNVVLPALATGGVAAPIVERARALLDRVGLGSRLESLPGELSGGERQRVAVDRALLLGPRLVLADEPTGQLDAASAEAVTELLVELASETGGMLVVATHSDAVARRIGRVHRLESGRLEPGRGAS